MQYHGLYSWVGVTRYLNTNVVVFSWHRTSFQSGGVPALLHHCYWVENGPDQRLPCHFWSMLYNLKKYLLVVSNSTICCVNYKWGVLLSKLFQKLFETELWSWWWVFMLLRFTRYCMQLKPFCGSFPAQLAWGVSSLGASLQEHRSQTLQNVCSPFYHYVPAWFSSIT